MISSSDTQCAGTAIELIKNSWRTAMTHRTLLAAIGIAALMMTGTSAVAFDDARYPNLKGQWYRPGGAPRFDPSQPRGPAQNPPLNAEYRAKFEASQRDMAAGGQGDHPVYRCLAWGMPGMMNLYGTMEVVILPEVTYLFIDDGNDSVRRIYTDGRSFPKEEIDPTFTGYSIGQWIDEDGDGKYDVLQVETRGPFKGPRAFDNSGLILHPDGETVIKERIYLDKNDPARPARGRGPHAHPPLDGAQDLQSRCQPAALLA
jgi:hypothetical protein